MTFDYLSHAAPGGEVTRPRAGKPAERHVTSVVGGTPRGPRGWPATTRGFDTDRREPARGGSASRPPTARRRAPPATYSRVRRGSKRFRPPNYCSPDRSFEGEGRPSGAGEPKSSHMASSSLPPTVTDLRARIGPSSPAFSTCPRERASSSTSISPPVGHCAWSRRGLRVCSVSGANRLLCHADLGSVVAIQTDEPQGVCPRGALCFWESKTPHRGSGEFSLVSPPSAAAACS